VAEAAHGFNPVHGLDVVTACRCLVGLNVERAVGSDLMTGAEAVRGLRSGASSWLESIIDWEMATPEVGRMTCAELLEVENAVIVPRGLTYDARDDTSPPQRRRGMVAAPAAGPRAKNNRRDARRSLDRHQPASIIRPERGHATSKLRQSASGIQCRDDVTKVPFIQLFAGLPCLR
jgi:hypothetical protein